MNWINVKDMLPEEDQNLIIASDISGMPERTVKLLVFTDTGNVTDNRRLKMQIGEKEWKWFMGYDGEVVTHWTTFEEPKI